MYFFCSDAVDQLFIVFCIIDTGVEVFVHVIEPVAIFFLGVFILLQHIFFDLLHVFGRRTFFCHFVQLFDNNARQFIFLGRVSLEYNLKNELFFRISAEASATVHAIATSFFFTDFCGVNHIQSLVKDAESHLVAQIILASAAEQEHNGSHRSFLLFSKFVFVLSFADFHLCIFERLFAIDRRQTTQIFGNHRFHFLNVYVSYEVECKVTGVFETVFVHF